MASPPASAVPSEPAHSVEEMSPNELASVTEIARLLGVPKRTAARYVNREDFPKPLDELATGRIWRSADVEKWGRTHLPLPRPGRPRKRPKEK